MAPQKTLVILYYGDDWNKSVPFESSPETRKSFEEFYEFATKEGWAVYRSSMLWFDEYSCSFHRGWTFSQKTWTRINKTIIPTAIFDKTAGSHDYALFDQKTNISQKVPVINSPLFRTLFDNKFSQYLAFSSYMPKTVLVENEKQFLHKLSLISSERIVAKEVYGSGGKNVSIKEKKEIISIKDTFKYPVILQEFIETIGIPGISNNTEIADLRLIYVGTELIYALSRCAKQGSLHTNFHQGAHAILIPLEKIPKECISMADEIRKTFSHFENINYSLDFMFNKNGSPFLIEINTTPGFDLLRIVGTSEIKNYFYTKLLTSF